jgi:hypothetical protein
MTRSFRLSPSAPAQLLLAGALALSTAFVAAPHAARADEPGQLTRALGLRTTVPEAPDFVAKSRAPVKDFIPVHSPRAKPAGKPMVKEEVAKQEKSLDAARIRQDRLAGRASAPRGKSVADEMVSSDDRPKTKAAPCALTCATAVVNTWKDPGALK